MESYFNGIWKDTSMSVYKHSGYTLVDYVNNQKPSSVLDIGCGYNRFKNKIHNLIGIDPYNDCADIKISIEDYNTVPYDIVLCLGSINFGDEKTIDRQLEKIHTMFRREAIFRVNPGIPHDWADYGDIEWYTWSKEKINNIASRFNYTIKCLETEHVIQGHERLFFIYTK